MQDHVPCIMNTAKLYYSGCCQVPFAVCLHQVWSAISVWPRDSNQSHVPHHLHQHRLQHGSKHLYSWHTGHLSQRTGRLYMPCWCQREQRWLQLHPRLVPLSKALYHACFICGQRCKWCSRWLKLTLSVISDVKPIVYIFYIITVTITITSRFLDCYY